MKADIQRALGGLGVVHIGEVTVSDIVFNPAFRAACTANQCGKYNTNWACPPGAGEVSALIARARRYARGLVIQSVWPLSDAFDFDGMMAGETQHNTLFRQAVALARTRASGLLALSAGACSLCETCTFPHGEPCRLPDQAIASLEAYCIDVTALVDTAGLAYNHGPNTVAYVGLILF